MKPINHARDLDLMISTMEDEDLIISRIGSMRRQEAGAYFPRHLFDHPSSETLKDEYENPPVNDECRRKMVEWSYQVVDHCKYERESVSIAASHLDRFLGTVKGAQALKDRKQFQLAAITAFLIAIKMTEPNDFTPKIMAKLSRGIYTDDEVAKMEFAMLMALRWHVNPPTALSFVQHYLFFLHDEVMGESMKENVLYYAKIQVEQAVKENFFAGVKPSIVAHAAISNAFSFVGHISLSTMQSYHKKLRENKLIDTLSGGCVRFVREMLLRSLPQETHTALLRTPSRPSTTRIARPNVTKKERPLEANHDAYLQRSRHNLEVC